MEIKIPSDSEHVIIDIINLLSLPKDFNVFHLCIRHFAEGLNQLLSELECKLILTEVPKSLIYEPNVHIDDRMVDMEITRNIHRVHEFP